MAEISVSGAGQIQKTAPQPNEVGQAGSSVGAGSVAAGGVVPDPTSQSYQAITQSLSRFFPTVSGDKIDILVAEASLKLKDIVGKTELNELHAKEEQKRQNAAEQRAAAEDAQKALEDARAAEAKAKKGGLFGKIFGGIASALAIIAGAILIATGAGAVLGAALIVGGVASAAMLTDQIMAEKTGMGLLGTLVTGDMKDLEAILPGVSFSEEAYERVAERSDKAFKIIAITVMVLSAVVTMGAGFAASSASAAGSAAASAGGAAATTSKSVDMFQKLSAVVSSIAMAGSGVATATTAVFSFQAAQDQAEAFRGQADVVRSQAFNELINDFIDHILARVSGTNSQFNAMLDDIVASIKDRGETLARVKFAS